MIMMVVIVAELVLLVELQVEVVRVVMIVSTTGLHMDLNVVIQLGMSMELTVQP